MTNGAWLHRITLGEASELRTGSRLEESVTRTNSVFGALP